MLHGGGKKEREKANEERKETTMFDVEVGLLFILYILICNSNAIAPWIDLIKSAFKI